MGDDDDVITCCSRRERAKDHMLDPTSSTRSNSWHWSYGLQITPYICAEYPGAAKISMSQQQKRAVSIRWTGADAEAIISEDGAVLGNAKPGKYVAHITNDVTGEKKRLDAQVPRLNAAVITSYTTQQCTRFPWNGEVKAVVENCPKDARFLWNNGVVTRDSRLTCARPGRYTVTLLHASITISACAPAVVESMM